MVPFSEPPAESAPLYNIGGREVVAVEHPMIVKNLENGLKTFGRGPAFSRILDSDSLEACVPLYLRPDDLMCPPILSRNAPTDNILLKITVPRRTGRKRKRGSEDPFSGIIRDHTNAATINILSQSRQDDPSELIRTLKDNLGKYNVEAVATIDHTHRFRGVADFHSSTRNAGFQSKLGDLVSSANVEGVRNFKFDNDMGWKKNEEIIPPAAFTVNPLPANWAWQENSEAVDTTEETSNKRKKTSKVRWVQLQIFAGMAKHLPDRNPHNIPDSPDLRSLITALEAVFKERPVWMRGALKNKMEGHVHASLLRYALPYVAYAISTGAFTRCVVKYGIDPRTDRKFAKYQVLCFRHLSLEEDSDGILADDASDSGKALDFDSHIFDGSRYVKGRFFQLCDVTEPLLVKLIESATLRDEFHALDGYICNGAMAKIRIVMKVKLLALLYNIPITPKQFEDALDMLPDIVDTKKPDGSRVSSSDLLNHEFRHAFCLPEEVHADRKARGLKEFPYGSIFRKPATYNSQRQRRIAERFSENANQNDPEELRLPAISKPALQAPTIAAVGSSTSLGAMEDPSVGPRPGEFVRTRSLSITAPPDTLQQELEDGDMAEYERGLAREDGYDSEADSGEEDEDEDEDDESDITDEADFPKRRPS